MRLRTETAVLCPEMLCETQAISLQGQSAEEKTQAGEWEGGSWGAGTLIFSAPSLPGARALHL